MIAIPTALSGILGGLKGKAIAVLAGLLLVAGIALYVQYLRGTVHEQRAEIASLQGDVTAAVAAADSAHAALMAERADHERALAAVSADLDAARQRAATLANIRSEIRNAPAADDAPAAPVLRHALDRLRQLRAGGDPR
ncbi:hypothetical protein [Oceanibaculum nanhaiense]|uniref:hypothetical protein n=1 Tax=Oceanibaculum nanhaiense TaxID=1909734 RepID=UPI003D2905BB